MISAAIGMVIMSAATVAMLVALDITTKELRKAWKAKGKEEGGLYL